MEENSKNQVDNNVDLDDVYQNDYEDCATEEDMILFFKMQVFFSAQVKIYTFIG
jgi:hypothetical protein